MNQHVMIEIDLQYFKSSGKFYDRGKIKVPEGWQMYEIADYVKELRDNGNLPGLISNNTYNHYSVYINAENHPNGYPVLINSNSLN